jgi:glutamate dehydrogenase (NAD(P)+)
VVVSYFEWLQGLQSFFWEMNDIYKRMERMMQDAFEETYALHQQEKVGPRRRRA